MSQKNLDSLKSSEPVPIHVNENCQISFDSSQWMLQTRGSQEASWVTRHYVATYSRILFRIFEEMNIVPDPLGAELLSELPETFNLWKEANANISQ